MRVIGKVAGWPMAATRGLWSGVTWLVSLGGLLKAARWLATSILLLVGIIGLILGALNFARYGPVPIVGSLGFLMAAIAFCPITAPWLKRRGRLIPLIGGGVGLLIGATVAVITGFALYGEDQRITAGQGSAPGVIAMLTPAATLGFTESQYQLGLAYLFGVDGPADTYTARYWMRRAAIGGDSDAYLALARLYLDDTAGSVDGQEALKWAQAAADAGMVGAENLIGSLYSPGGPLPPDPDKATQAYALGHEQNDPDATFNLALAYQNGTGVDPDLNQAADLYRQAAQAGRFEAQLNYAAALMNGAGVERNDEEARYWLEVAKQRASGPATRLIDDNLKILDARRTPAPTA